MPPRPEHDTALAERLLGEQETNAFLREQLNDLTESLASLELAMDDAGWRRLTVNAQQEFSRDGLRQITAACRIYGVKNPLIKRALALRHAYVWGGDGVQISARAASDEDGGQDVNGVVQSFLDEPSNRRVFTGDQAGEENGRALGTDGNVFIACFAAPKTGAVRVRVIPWDEIVDVVTNPDDASEPWFYLRQSTSTKRTSLTAVSQGATEYTLYPALSYKPKRLTSVRPSGGTRPSGMCTSTSPPRYRRSVSATSTPRWTGARLQGIPGGLGASDALAVPVRVARNRQGQ